MCGIFIRKCVCFGNNFFRQKRQYIDSIFINILTELLPVRFAYRYRYDTSMRLHFHVARHRRTMLQMLSIPVFYLLFLLVLPILVSYTTPCLTGLSESYSDADCTVALVLDRYSIFVISGFTVCVLLTYYLFNSRQKQFSRTFLLTVLVASVLAGETIFAYYRFIPFAEKKVRAAPIILDTMTAPVPGSHN